MASATVVERMFMLIMSAKPLTASATSESTNQCERPNTTMLTPNSGDDAQQRPPRVVAQRPPDEEDPGEERADGGSAAQDAEALRADVEDRAREHRQQRDGAAEQHGEQVERDRAQDHRRVADEADAGEQALRGRAPPPALGRAMRGGPIASTQPRPTSSSAAATP